MADVWKSVGKRYCEICKVWFGNNKASQDHHDRGDRHKAMLQQKIRETMQKGKKQELADAKLNGTLARMEAAAAASMASYGEGVVQGPQLPKTGLKMNIFDPKQHKDVGSMAREMAARREGNLKRKGLSGSAPPAQEPSLKITKDDVVSAYRDLTNPSAHGPALPEALAVGYMPETQVQCAEIQWVQAKSAEGTYYWNLFDKSTRWEAPAHFYTAKQYEEKVREFEESRAKNYYGLDDVVAVRQGKTDVESYIKSVIAQQGLDEQVDKNRKELNITDKPTKASKAERRRQWLEKKRLREEEMERRKAEGITEEKDVKKEAQEVEEEEEEDQFDDIPLPEESTSAPAIDIYIPPPAPPTFEENEEEDQKEIKKESEETEEPKIEEKILASSAPFGAWVRITKEEKSTVPFESPLTARFREEEEREKAEAEIREKEEPKIEFGEKTAATMTKKVKGPIEFKKKSTNRNIRKREE